MDNNFPMKQGDNKGFDKWLEIMKMEWVGKGMVGDNRGQIKTANISPEVYSKLQNVK